MSVSRTSESAPPLRPFATPGTAVAASAVLSVRQATRLLGGRRVLDGVSLDVAGGRIVALAGPNGAGKTSLMRAVAGRLRLDSGAITIEGVPPSDARARGRLGIVPQDIALYPHLTVRENLSVLGRLAGLSAPTLNGRIDDGLQWAGLADRAGSLVRTLSGGMRRRVNLVAGVLHRPALLLLDEPTVGVDAESEARLHGLLRGLRDAGMAVVMATHDLDEAAVLCDDLVVMGAGRIRVAAPLGSLVSRVFPAGPRLVVSVGGDDTADGSRALSASGFSQTGPRTWVRTAADLRSLGEVGARLAASGVAVEEMRWSEPSLRGAIAALLSEGGADDAPAEHHP